MPRIPRTGTLAPLRLATAPPFSSTRPCFAASRAVSSTRAAQAENSSWLRKKLWRGEAPGPADPYTERPATENVSNLPDEALEPRPQQWPQSQPEPETNKTPSPWETRLVLPPKRTEAMVQKEIEASDPTYVPATDMQGLEEIPTLKNWWDLPGHWGEESEFRGFGAAEKVTANPLVEVYLRAAVIEALVLKHTGKLGRSAGHKWCDGDASALRRALAINMRVKWGELWLEGDVYSLSQTIDPLREPAPVSVEKKKKTPVHAEAESPPPEKVSLQEAKLMIGNWGQPWKKIILDDQLKFAVSPNCPLKPSPPQEQG